MKLRELISKINKSDKFKNIIYIGDIAESVFNLFNIYDYSEQTRLVSYYYGSWYCTDSYVGFKVYFFDDEAVAVTYQGGRKGDEEFTWLSKEAYIKVRDYVITFQQPDDENFNFTTCTLDEEMGDTYKIHFNGQLFDYHKNIPLYKGENVKIIKADRDSKDRKGWGINQILTIEYSDKRTEEVNINELDFPFNIIE